MSGVQEETLKSVGILRQKLAERACLCDGISYNESNFRDILCDLTIENRDEILLKLSLLTDLFAAKHCRWIQDTLKSLKEDAVLLDSMKYLLRYEDSLVAFCACKCLVAATTEYSQYGQTGFLKGLIKSIKQVITDPMMSYSANEVNQVVYTLDMFKRSIQSTDQRDDAVEDDKNKSNICIRDEVHGTNISNEQSLATPAHYDAVMEDLQSLTDVFLHMSTSWCDEEPCVHDEHQQINVVTQGIRSEAKDETRNAGRFTKTLMAFLELLLEMVKQTLKRSQQPKKIGVIALIFKKVSEFLWMDNLPTVLMKKIVEIENCSMDCFLELQKLTAEGENIALVANEIVTQIANGRLEKIPYRNMPHGFGGVIMMQDDSSGLLGDFCSGDYPLLRQLVRLGMSAAIIVLQHTSRAEAVDDVVHSMSATSQYIASKMELRKDRDLSSWLVELFGDQDDSLILTMMRTLQLYKLLDNQTTKTISGTTNKQEELNPKLTLYCDILSTLNPHIIFIRFLETITFDPNLLLDLLISNETCFLEYMVQYVHMILSDWVGFCYTNSTINVAERVSDIQEEAEKQVADGEEKREEEREQEEMGFKYIENKITVSSDTDLAVIKSDNGRKLHLLKDETEASVSDYQGNNNKSLNISTTFQEFEEISECKDNKAQLSPEITGKQSHLVLFVDHSTDETIDNGPQCKRRKILPSGCNANQINTVVQVPIQSRCHKAPDDFESSVEINKVLDETMTVLIRLRLSVEKMSNKGLFPYNVAPLLRLLERVEEKYDS